MPPKTGIVEIYEDRIARLEEGVTDCKVDLGVVKTQLSDGFSMLSEKLDVVANLSERVAALETRESIRSEVKESEERSHNKRHERRSRFIKYGAALGSVLVAIAGLVLKIMLGG